MADKEPKRGTPLIVTVLIIAIVMFVKYYVNQLCVTLVGTGITGEDDAGLVLLQMISSFIASIICGFILAIILYRGVQNDSEERRLVLEYFRETTCDNQHIKEYIKADKVQRKGFIIIAVLLFLGSVVLNFFTGLLYVVYPVILEYLVMLGICRLFLYRGRYRLYKQWDSERLRR